MEQSTTPTGNSSKLVISIAVILGVIVMIVMLIKFSKFSENKKSKDPVNVETLQKPEQNGNTDSDTDHSALLTQAANDVNKSCPFMVDKETRLDNAMALPNNTLQYNYTLLNMVEGSVDPESMKAYMRPTLLNMIRTNPELELFRNYRTSFAYSYNDMNGVYLFKLVFTPDQYQ